MIGELLLWGLALLASFYFLAKIVDGYFVGSLEIISNKLKLRSDVAGATLMAIGSSAPELFVSLLALIKPGSHEEIGMGTIVGSAIFNVLVIVGISAVVKTAVLSWQPVVRDTLFYVISIILLLIFFLDGRINFFEAVVLVIVYALYILAVIYWNRLFPQKKEDGNIMEQEDDHKNEQTNMLSGFVEKILKIIFPNKKHYWFIFVLSIVFIAALSWVLVESAVGVAEILRIPSAIIALTVLAVGTSIPDLMSSVIVAKKGKGGMAISNAIGSNVFDILIGLGLSWAIMIMIRPGRSIAVSNENLISSIILLFATVLVIFFLLLIQKWKIGRKGGYFLVGLYVAYLVWSIVQVL